MSIELVVPSSHLILCHPLLLLPPIPPSIRVFSNELTLRMRWPKYRSFSYSLSPSKDWSPLEWAGWISLQSKGPLRVFSNTTVQKYMMWNTRLDESQAGIKIAGRNINNLRYADDTTLMAESKEEIKSLLMKLKEKSGKSWLKTEHSKN